jgi:hypothetical protein
VERKKEIRKRKKRKRKEKDTEGIFANAEIVVGL